MSDTLISIGIVVLLYFSITKTVSSILAHWLNLLFKLPHPGPNDIQGCCWCRRHEGPDKYTFKDYLKYSFSSKEGRK